MKLCEASKWEQWVENNTDPYGKAVIDYAERWANLMEERIENGETVADCAKETSNEADIDGITGFMYGASVGVLATSWAWGEELRRWHNADYGQPNAQGVVNPAIITIGED